jgi:hypothetical protein
MSVRAAIKRYEMLHAEIVASSETLSWLRGEREVHL